ncbi:MAG: YciI family protein [Micromonosporaceae bacterium]
MTTVANYLIMIYDNEAELAGADASVVDEELRHHATFAEKYGYALRGGAQLTNGATATSIRHHSDGTTTVTDGTFAETKEVLGGYYVVEAADLDEAMEIAKHVPARFGGVEVRPMVSG